LNNPYLITEPTVISFSGGRTSAYMLWKCLEAHNGNLPPQAIICFANTGKEEEETLKFVNDCANKWNVNIVWLEYQNIDGKHDYKIVNFDTASRNGEPFEAMIRHYKMLPNPRNKSCTQALKTRTLQRYLKANGWNEWTNFIGMRADEMHRVRRLKPDTAGESMYCPLAHDNVSKEVVTIFWEAQTFDLNLPTINGKTLHGNCDLCYLKNGNQTQSLIAEKPERAIWWARMEKIAEDFGAGNGSRFRLDRPSYQQMYDNALNQKTLDFADESIECFCGD